MQNELLTSSELLLTGKDALDLLHRISTVNVKSLPLNKPCPTLILNPLGKIESAFVFTKISSEQGKLTLDKNAVLKTKSILEHYTFAEKYTVEEIQNSAPIEMAMSEKERITSLIPLLGKEYFLNGETNPLEVNLGGSIHDQKGCYPGQEIIEKIIALGSPARRLCLLSVMPDSKTESLPTPCHLLDEKTNAEIGTLTSYTNGFGLGIIRRTHAKDNLILKTPTTIVFKIEKVSL